MSSIASGTPAPNNNPANSTTAKMCGIPECTRTDIQGNGWCRMHYHRWWRTGEPGTAARRQRLKRNPQCEIEGCMKPDRQSGLCLMHATRKRRHGSPHTVIAASDRKMPKGEDNPKWVGDAAGYWTVHSRVSRQRGKASDHSCACGAQAAQWSYDHADENERIEISDGYRLAYSLNLEHYVPLCVPCHKRFDLALIKQGKLHNSQEGRR